MTISHFEGFPKETTQFLERLEANNTKAWFDEHRNDYQDFLIAPAKDFVVAAGEQLQAIAPVQAEPRVNGSIFRINRDTRFSKGKTPYKNHLDLRFWEGGRKRAASGFFLRIGGGQVGIGVGAHGFDRDRLEAFRDAVTGPKSGPALRDAVSEVEGAGHPVKGKHYKQIPRGHTARDAFEERLLLFNALWIGVDGPAPASLGTPAFVDWAIERWAKMRSLHRWLVDTLQ